MVAFFWQLHLHIMVQSRFAFPHKHERQFPLQLHLMSSLVHFDTSGIVIQSGTHFPLSSLQPKDFGKSGGNPGTAEFNIQTPAKYKVMLELKLRSIENELRFYKAPSWLCICCLTYQTTEKSKDYLFGKWHVLCAAARHPL